MLASLKLRTLAFLCAFPGRPEFLWLSGEHFDSRPHGGQFLGCEEYWRWYAWHPGFVYIVCQPFSVVSTCQWPGSLALTFSRHKMFPMFFSNCFDLLMYEGNLLILDVLRSIFTASRTSSPQKKSYLLSLHVWLPSERDMRACRSFQLYSQGRGLSKENFDKLVRDWIHVWLVKGLVSAIGLAPFSRIMVTMQVSFRSSASGGRLPGGSSHGTRFDRISMSCCFP